MIARAGLALLALCAAAAGRADDASQRSVDRGIVTEFRTIAPTSPGGAMGFRFDIQDTASHTPLSGLRPAAWLSLHDDKAPAVDCEKKVARFLSADLFQRADVDLNSYYVLSMDDAPSISVVDPLFGFGGSKLLAMVPLESPGADWAQNADRLFVTMPKVGKLAVADTHDWKLVANVRTGPTPTRVLMGGAYAWVADAHGLTAVDVKTLTATSLPLGAVADIAVSDESDLVFATGARHITVVNARDARVLGRVTLDGTPTRLDYSRVAKALYALDAQAGRVYVVDGGTRTLRSTIDVRAGATQLRFAPDGRHALLPNPDENVVQVLDAASDRIVQNIAIDEGPERVSFTDLLAYVRRRHSEIVPMIALTQIGSDFSRWCLVASIAGIGMKTQLRELITVGFKPVALMIGETLFLAGLVLLLMRVLA